MLVESRLFREMTIVPYTDCLEGFAGLMRKIPIATHVRTLNYDAESRYDEEGQGQLLDDGRRQYSSSHPVLTFLCVNALKTGDQIAEVLLLSDCLRSLPPLDRISVQESSCDRLESSVEGLAAVHPARSACLSRLRRLVGDFWLVRDDECPDESEDLHVPGSRNVLFTCVASESFVSYLSINCQAYVASAQHSNRYPLRGAEDYFGMLQ